MKHITAISSLILVVLLPGVCVSAQRNMALADNAALRYWSAFSAVQDSAITDEQARELNAILDGTAPYDDTKYKDLLEKNTLALEIMARATSLANCDWGLDYGAEDVPVEYARKALVLGRLNVLYAFHLFIAGNKDGGVRTFAAGLRFSHDVGNGGSLFATLIAKDLLVNPTCSTWSSFLQLRERSCRKPLDDWGKDLIGERRQSLIWKAFAVITRETQSRPQL